MEGTTARPLPQILRLAGVVSFAVTMPIFSFLLENRHSLQISPWGALRVAIVFWLIPIAVLSLVWAIAFRRGPWILSVATTGGIAAILAQAASRAGLPAVLVPAAQILLFVGFLAIGLAAAIRLASVLAPVLEAVGSASVLVTAGFIFIHVLRAQTPAPARPHEDAPIGPVMVVVFDGLSDFALDSSLPAFRRLTDEGFHLREAWTNSDQTFRSIPMILSGRWDTELVGLDRSDRSLFARVAERYDLEVYGVALDYVNAFGSRAVRCMDDRDLFDVHPEILDELISRWFAWRVFPHALQRPLEEDDFRRFMKRASRSHAEAFLRSLDAKPLEHRFYFVHLFHPHPPFSTTSDGRVLDRDVPDAYYHAERPEDLEAIRRLHREEVVYCDAVVGRIRAALERRGAWDDALLVVTADHGLSSEWATRMYGCDLASDTMTDELARVPLFLKLPRRLAGARLSPRYQHLDLAPTLLDAMGLSSDSEPVPGNGRSLFRGTPSFDAPRVVTKFATAWTRDAATGDWVRSGN